MSGHEVVGRRVGALCRTSVTRRPAHAEELGFAALKLTEFLNVNLGIAELIEDLRARAWSYIGNSRRIQSDLQGAEEAFVSAYSHLHKGTRDPLEWATLLDLEATLRSDQRRFEDAFRLLWRAIATFLRNDQKHKAGRSLVNLSTVYHYAGDPERGIPILYQALDLIDPGEEPRLLLVVRHNLVDYLASSGRYLEAQRFYQDTQPLYQNFPGVLTQNRRKWVEGKIARGLGQIEQAESLFLAARDGFIGEGILGDTALVSLELATLYAEHGRTADLKRLAEEMVPLFSSQHIHRETLAALAYLQRAAAAERATVDLISKVADFVQRAERDPNLRFEGPPDL